MTDIKVGQRVKTVANVRPAKYASKRGTVSEINRVDDEIGVVFRERGHSDNPVTVWFKVRELAL